MHHNDNPIRVLLVDDDPLNAELLEEMLAEESGAIIHYLDDPAKAVEVARAFAPSLVLVDLRMPGTDGFEVIGALKRDPVTACMPVLMLSGEESPHVKAAGLAAGAVDYLVKWPDRIELTARVRVHSGAYHARRALEESGAALVRRTEELAAAQAALHEAQKMEAIGKLTSSVAHEFNNILQLIQGNLQLMRIGQADDKSLRRIDAASEGVRRGARVASQLLAVSRSQPQHSATVDLAAFLRGIEATVLASCDLRIHGAPHAAAVDPVQLQTVLAELVTNAREATNGQGSVSIELDGESLPAQAGALEAGAYVRIRVADSGAGMAPEVQRRAFEPFFTTKPFGRGSGLGLSIAFGFVRQSRGHIFLDSEPSRGTTVTMYFPRQAAHGLGG